MQPTEAYSVPRRPLDVEDYIDIMRRHKSWVFGPFLLVLVASVVGVYLWPDSYESIAVVKIVPQQVPQNMVQSAITQDMADRIASMATTVLSRNVLTTIINNFDLYRRQKSRMPIEDVIELMHTNVKINPILTGANGRTVPAFTVQFSYENRYLAQKVVSDLVSRFIDANIRDRSDATFQTTAFLKDQVEQAKKELDALETELSQFRVQNNGRLPDQVDANVRQLAALQTTYQFLTNSISRAEQEKLLTDAGLRVARDRKAELSKEPQILASTAKSERVLDIEREIRGLEDVLNVALQKYRDTHPDVQSVRSRLEVAKNRRLEILREDAEAKKTAAPVPVSRQLQMELLDLEGNIQRLESAIQAKNLEIADYQRQLKQIQDSINSLQARINATPLGERQYSDLLRERELAKEKYVDLDVRLNKAEIAQQMEDRKQGERLELLDAATLPINPTEPKRVMIISIGAAIGLLLGVILAGAREMKDTSLKNLKDVRAYTQMAILGSVPLLENDFVVRRRKRLAWVGWTTACLAAAVTMAGSVVYYYATKV